MKQHSLIQTFSQKINASVEKYNKFFFISRHYYSFKNVLSFDKINQNLNPSLNNRQMQIDLTDSKLNFLKDFAYSICKCIAHEQGVPIL